MSYKPAITGRQSTANSTVIPLVALDNFTGPGELCLDFPRIVISLKTDASVDGTLYMEFSSDNVNWDRSKPFAVVNGVSEPPHTLVPVGEYYRVRYVNGTTAQTFMRLSSYMTMSGNGLVSSIDQTVGRTADVELNRIVNDYALDIARGALANRSSVAKFGFNVSVGAEVEEDIHDAGGLYTGWLTSADNIRIKAGGHADDAAAGTGVRSVVVEGLDSNWASASVTLACNANGTLASASSAGLFIRVFRAYALDSGTYGVGNAGPMVIETAGGIMLAQIEGPGDHRAPAQTQMAIYAVPAGKTAYARRVTANVQGGRDADILFWKREAADDIVTPFTAPRVWHEFGKLSGPDNEKFESVIEFPEKTDIWVSAVGPVGGAAVSAGFDLWLVDN